MNDLWRLLRIQLLGFFDINIAFHTRDRKVRIKKLLLSGLMLLVFLTIMGMFFMYSYLLASQLKKFGMISSMEYVPGWMMAAASLATFFTTVYKTHGVLLGFKDYEQIMSLPIPVETVIASRILLLYLLNVFYTLIIMIPAGIVYIMEGEPLTSFYVLFPVTLLFVPLVPIVAAAGLGIGISMISSRFKHRNAVTLVTSFLLVIGILAFSSGAEEMAIDFKNGQRCDHGCLGIGLSPGHPVHARGLPRRLDGSLAFYRRFDFSLYGTGPTAAKAFSGLECPNDSAAQNGRLSAAIPENRHALLGALSKGDFALWRVAPLRAEHLHGHRVGHPVLHQLCFFRAGKDCPAAGTAGGCGNDSDLCAHGGGWFHGAGLHHRLRHFFGRQKFMDHEIDPCGAFHHPHEQGRGESDDPAACGFDLRPFPDLCAEAWSF